MHQTAPQPRIPQRSGVARSNLVELTLFTVMVVVIATVAFAVMGEYGWLAACFLGGGIGLLAGIVLAILLGSPRSTPKDKPIGRAPRASGAGDPQVVPARSSEERPNTTLQSRGLGSVPDAGGVGRPATPEARSPLDPAELPIAGAGGPLQPATVEEAKKVAGASSSGSSSGSGSSSSGGGTSGTSGTSGTDGAVAYDPATSSSKPIVKPATARGAPEPVGETGEGPRVHRVEPVKPEMLDEPREGGPDDLTKIRGIGPALQDMLHRMGIYHFDQIASWNPAEVAWVDENIEDFKGRVTRDDWVGQAEDLRGG